MDKLIQPQFKDAWVDISWGDENQNKWAKEIIFTVKDISKPKRKLFGNDPQEVGYFFYLTVLSSEMQKEPTEDFQTDDLKHVYVLDEFDLAKVKDYIAKYVNSDKPLTFMEFENAMDKYFAISHWVS